MLLSRPVCTMLAIFGAPFARLGLSALWYISLAALPATSATFPGVAIPGKVADVAGNAASEMYQSALKPNLANGAPKIASMVQTGRDNSIPISGAGVEKIGSLIDNLNNTVSAQIAA